MRGNEPKLAPTSPCGRGVPRRVSVRQTRVSAPPLAAVRSFVRGAGSQPAASRLVSTSPEPSHGTGISIHGYLNRRWTTDNPLPASRISLEPDSAQYRFRFVSIRDRCAPSGRKTRLAKMGGRYGRAAGLPLGRTRLSTAGATGWDRRVAVAGGVHG